MEDEESKLDLELELDADERIFIDERERKELHNQMAQLSPRRRTTEGATTSTTTLPFYEDISPSEAVERLFKWFHVTTDDERERMELDAEAQEAISFTEFNRLRRCLGKDAVTEREWERALEELGAAEGDGKVKRKDFKALFGPPPYFGSQSVQGIVQSVMKAEEYIHFAQMLLDRFGKFKEGTVEDGLESIYRKNIGFAQLQELQRACCAESMIDSVGWIEICQKLHVPEPYEGLDWMHFTEAFSVLIDKSTSKRLFSPHADPAAVVYAVLANENVMASIKDPDEDRVTGQALTNLLRNQRKQVDDEGWLHLLQNVQTSYNADHIKQSEEATMANDSGREKPYVVVRNTKNQVLSYEIVFDGGDTGLELQSDFYGHCLTVSSISGQAKRHPIIQKHDIVAAVNDVNLTQENMAANKDQEKEWLGKGMDLLSQSGSRKVTFHRQESYFQYSVSHIIDEIEERTERTLHIFMKTIDEIPHNAKLTIQVPNMTSWNSTWKPSSDDLEIEFEAPQDPDLEYTEILWSADSQSIEVKLQGHTAIASNSLVVMKITGMDCGETMMVGPCEMTQSDDSKSFISLYNDWKYRESTLRKNPVRERTRRTGEILDSSVQPLGKCFHSGDSGLTLGSDFFGQCPVVTTVKSLSQGSQLDVRVQDILSSIISIGDKNGVMLNQFNCIKPFALGKRDSDAHIKAVQERLATCHKSGRPYYLQFLRLSSDFYHDNGRTIFTFRARTSLRGNSSLMMKMPNHNWNATGPVVSKVIEPPNVLIRETFWDSQQHSLHLVIDNGNIAETSQIVLEIEGLTAPSEKCAGPSVVVGVHHGDSVNAPEMDFTWYDNWHSFMEFHHQIDASTITETLKRFKTSPAMLWDVLEYTSLLFDMSKTTDSEHMTISNLNNLIETVCGSGKKMNPSDWDTLCYNLGANPVVGLSRRQFACCWYDLIGLNVFNAKDIYIRLHTAERLFKEIILIFQEEDEQDLITFETIEKLAKIAGFSDDAKTKAIAALRKEQKQGWDCGAFSQIVCGGNTAISFEDNASRLWVKIYYAKKLYDDFSSKKRMRKKNLDELLCAARVSEPKLTNRLWTEVCDSVDADDVRGLSLGHFIEVYAGDMLGSRHSLADYYRIETFKLLPERRGKDTEVSKEAVLNIAPEKVNVKDVAAKALDETASAEELFQDLLSQGLEFSKLAKIEEKVVDTFQFETNLVAKNHSRAKGFLHMEVRSITELADRLIQKNSTFNKDSEEAEELYLMFEVTDAKGLIPRVPPLPKTNKCSMLKNKLFGEKEDSRDYIVTKEELWDNGKTQALMKQIDDLEKELKNYKIQTPEYQETTAKIMDLEKQFIPSQSFDGRIFSSLILRDPSPDAIIRFPEDKFRLYVDYPENDPFANLYVVCKLFKRIGSKESGLQLELKFAQVALYKAEMTYKILQNLVEQQDQHLRHIIAEEHSKGKESVNDNRVWTNLSKLKQKRQDLADFGSEVRGLKANVARIEGELQPYNDKRGYIDGVQSASDQVKAGDNTNEGVDEKAERIPNFQLEDPQLDEIKRVKFVGQMFFEMGELFRVLHDDKEYTEDLATFTTEHHHDVGLILVYFQYKCESMKNEVIPTSLASMTISMSGNEKTSDITKVKTETAYEYPSHSDLELEWISDILKRGDRLCIVREGDAYKLSMPYFLLLWNEVDNGKNDTSDSDPNSNFDWWVPDILKTVYSSKDKIVNTDVSKRSGNLHFPSSIDLSLPPGTYKIYLIRNETDKQGNNFRLVLGNTPTLAVLPGINSVHTSFGTTPLIDVKPVSASLQVFADRDRESVSDALTNPDGNVDGNYVKSIELEQEIEVTRNDIVKGMLEFEKLKVKKEGIIVKQKLERLQMILEDLFAAKLALREKNVNAPTTTIPVENAAKNSTFSHSDVLVFSYWFQIGEPCTRDVIVLLPADVVRVADLLRSTILGKLQANDPQQVNAVRATMEFELNEVAQFVNMKFTITGLLKIIRRWIQPYLGFGGGTGPTDKSDQYKAITQAGDGSFVWDECMKAYKNASSTTKKSFAFIIRDLLDEIGARKTQLGITGNSELPNQKVSLLLSKVGIEIPIVPSQATRRMANGGINTSSKNTLVGEYKYTLGSRFQEGGFFVAKYIRRPAESGNAPSTINDTTGEICRFGPFYIEPAIFSIDPVQVLLYIGNLLKKIAMSDQGKLVMKIIAQFYLSLAKYFLAIVSLSFNISVLSGNFNIGVGHLKTLLHDFQLRLANYFGPVNVAFDAISRFFSGYISDLLARLQLFDAAGECFAGFFLYAILGMLFSATFIVYVVVQEDLLLKVQKLHTYLSFSPGKTLAGILEQVGALLVIPLYLTIKSCVLFISRHWTMFYNRLMKPTSVAMAEFKLFTVATEQCPHVDLAKINYGFGFAAVILIVIFLFICLPLLLLDLFSWVPLTELEDKQKLDQLSHSYKRDDIKSAVHSNANLVEIQIKCPSKIAAWRPIKCPSRILSCAKGFVWRGSFKRRYDDYMSLGFQDLLKKYGYFGLFWSFIYIYAHLMFQSFGRAFGALLGWRGQGKYMYKHAIMRPTSKWKVCDIFCFRFNLAWKAQYIKDKMIMPLVNICMVTLGLWGETQCKEFNVEERANDCYRMEPSGEIKQLQMMTLHGKIVSLFWLCVPKTMVLAYLSEVLNRGPVFGYFLNSQFLQADIPESEREKDPIWRFHSLMAFSGEEDVVYLSETRFYTTALKWGSALVEIISLLMVFPSGANNQTALFGISLISAVVAPLIEMNQQMIKIYVDYTETLESFVSSKSLGDAWSAVKKVKDGIGDLTDGAPSVSVNLQSIAKENARWTARKEAQKKKEDASQGVNPASAGSPATTSTNTTEQTTDKSLGKTAPPEKNAKKSTVGQTTATASSAIGGNSTSPTTQIKVDDQTDPQPDGNSSVVGKTLMASQMMGGTGAGVSIDINDDDDNQNDDKNDDNDNDDDNGNDDEDNKGDDNDDDNADDEDDDNGDNQSIQDTAAAAAVAATGLIKTVKSLILLSAKPDVSYVVLTDALDVGEGEITLNWEINAKQRFHALDAIGMFPARAPGDFTIRTMEDCICYRLLKDKIAERFGWSPLNQNSDDFERELIIRQAKSLRDVSEREVTRIAYRALSNAGDENSNAKKDELLKRADSTITTMLHSPKLKPYKKKMSDMLEEEVIENKLHLKVRTLLFGAVIHTIITSTNCTQSPKTSRMYSKAVGGLEEAAKKARKVPSRNVVVLSGNVKLTEFYIDGQWPSEISSSQQLRLRRPQRV